MAKEITTTPREKLIYIAIDRKGDWNKVYEDLKAHRQVDEAEVRKAVDSLDCNVLTFLDEEYPETLKNSIRPPFVLFYKGNVSLIADQSKCVSFVGSRMVEDLDALEEVERMSETLSEADYAIVAGSAKGTCAHALESAKKPVCVMGSGFHKPYPMETDFNAIAEKGLVLTEYPPNVGPEARNFPIRNRIVASLSAKMVCGETKERSGAMIAVAFALEMGKDVGCVVARCNTSLLENGACPVSRNSILEFAK